MDEIREIYNREVYDPFLDYCERNNYRTMQDLIRFPFGPLALSEELPAPLLNRVKTTFYMYVKKHPEVLRKAAQKSAVDTKQLAPQLEKYFAQNANKLINITDVMKSVGGGYKRADVQQLLEQATWCKVVDKSTYFYAPEN